MSRRARIDPVGGRPDYGPERQEERDFREFAGGDLDQVRRTSVHYSGIGMKVEARMAERRRKQELEAAQLAVLRTGGRLQPPPESDNRGESPTKGTSNG